MIAVVDDDVSLRNALVDLMGSLGLIVESFGSAEAFLQSGHSDDSDCLIADIQMPGMSGLDLFKRLAESGRQIPTILITAHHNERIRDKALQAGVAKFLMKPFRDDELIAAIREVREGDAPAVKRILMIHPIESDRNYFQAVLRDEGYVVELAKEIPELLARLRERQVDLVLVHAMRLDALSAIVEMPDLARIPAAVITSYSTDYVEDRLKSRGMNVPTVAVPISATDLAAAVIRCMR